MENHDHSVPMTHHGHPAHDEVDSAICSVTMKQYYNIISHKKSTIIYTFSSSTFPSACAQQYQKWFTIFGSHSPIFLILFDFDNCTWYSINKEVKILYIPLSRPLLA